MISIFMTIFSIFGMYVGIGYMLSEYWDRTGKICPVDLSSRLGVIFTWPFMLWLTSIDLFKRNKK